ASSRRPATLLRGGISNTRRAVRLRSRERRRNSTEGTLRSLRAVCTTFFISNVITGEPTPRLRDDSTRHSARAGLINKQQTKDVKRRKRIRNDKRQERRLRSEKEPMLPLSASSGYSQKSENS